MGAQDSALDVLDGQSWEAGPRQCCGVRRSRADWEDMKKSRADWEEEEPGEWGEVKRSRAERSHAGWRGEDVAEEELRSEQQQWGDELQQQQPQPQQGLGVLRRTQVALHMVLAKCVVSFTALHKTGCSEHMVLAKCAVSFTALHKTGCSEHMDPAQNRRFHPLHCAQCAHLRSPPSQSEVVECAGEWGRGGGRKRQLQCQRA
eukprot:1160509-Pelagomonas_calceolata.AAC.5